MKGNLGEGFSVAPGAGDEDEEILHRASEADPDDDPEEAGEIAELRGEDRADEGACAADRGEVVAEENPLVGGLVILTVFETDGGGDALVIQRRDFGRQKGAVIP